MTCALKTVLVTIAAEFEASARSLRHLNGAGLTSRGLTSVRSQPRAEGWHA